MQLPKETRLVFFVITIIIGTKRGKCLENGNYSASDCFLHLKKVSIPGEVDKFIDTGHNLIKYNFNVDEDNGPFAPKSTKQHDLLKPYSLVLALDPVGKSLLHLKESFIPMSLYTLEYGVAAEIAVDLIQSSPDCLRDVLAEDLETELKLLVFRNFGNITSEEILQGEICNQHVHATEDGTGIVRYTCCKFAVGDNLVCFDLDETVWIKMFFAAVIIVQLVFLLYSPSFVPSSSIMDTYQRYIFKPTKYLKLNVLRVKDDTEAKRHADGFVKANCHSENLKHKLSMCHLDEVYTLKVSKVTFDVKVNKILPGSPISFFKFMKSFFLQLNMRNDVSDLKPCCETHICKICTWYKCLMPFVWLLFLSVCVSPWLVRIWFFYAFEDENRGILMNSLKHKGLSPPYPGSLVLFLTPTHPLFWFIHVIFLVLVGYFYLLSHDIKSSLKYTIRVSLRRMHKRKKFDSFVTFIAHILFPLEACKLNRILLLPLWLVGMMSVGLIILGFCIFPLVNLTVRLLINLIYNICSCCRINIKNTNNVIYEILERWRRLIIVDKHNKTEKKSKIVFLGISQALLCIFAFPFFVLFVECIAFYAELFVYIIIGIILNSKYVMKFLTLAVIIALHAYDCFSSVGKTYESFAKVVNSEIQDKTGKSLKITAKQPKETQQRQAFSVPLQRYSAKGMTLLADREDTDLKWKASRLALFLDKNDIPYLSSSFFYRIVNMGHAFCPKPVYKMYFMALVELIWIMLFLGFVMLVVVAFGGAHNISETNQTLATLASGLLPFAFRKLFKSSSVAKLDRDNLGWQTKLEENIDKDTSFWTVREIDFDGRDPALSRHFQRNNKILSRKILKEVQIIAYDDQILVRKTPVVNESKPIYVWSPGKVDCLDC